MPAFLLKREKTSLKAVKGADEWKQYFEKGKRWIGDVK